MDENGGDGWMDSSKYGSSSLKLQSFTQKFSGFWSFVFETIAIFLVNNDMTFSLERKEKHLRKKHSTSTSASTTIRKYHKTHSRNRRYGNSYRVANVRMYEQTATATIKIYIWSVIVKWPKTTVNNYHHHRHYHHDNNDSDSGNDDEDDNLSGVALFGNATLDMKPLEQHLKPFAITVVVTFASAPLMWRSYTHTRPALSFTCSPILHGFLPLGCFH